MNILRKIILTVSFIIVSTLAILYFAFLFVLPKVAASERVVSKVESLVYEKANIKLDISNLKLRTHPNLSAELSVENLTAPEFLKADNVYICFKPLNIMPGKVSADYIFFDKTKYKSKPKSEKTFKLDVNKIPDIQILRGDVVINKDFSIKIEDLYALKDNDRKVISFKSLINTKLVTEKITAGQNGYLFYDKNGLCADKFQVGLGKSNLILDGKLYGTNADYNFSVVGKGLPIAVLEKNFLYFFKLTNKKKNFIENFYDFSGNTDVNLKVSKSAGITGNAIVKKLSAKTVKFNIPITLPYVDFKFKGDRITAQTDGNFGNEKVYTDVDIQNLFSKTERTVVGNVKSTLTSKFSKIYTPEYRIKGAIPATVNYHVKNHIITVKYNAEFPQNSNIYYRNADLGLMDRARRVFAQTRKSGDDLVLEKYDYSFVDNGNVQNIILGDGLFVKKNGHFTLDYITCQTNGDAPVSVTGSFGRYVSGGTFNGNLKYSNTKNLLTGEFNLKNSGYKNFYVKKAAVKANEETFSVAAEGDYEKSPFICYADLVNSFGDKITINDFHIYLHKYVIKHTGTHSKPIDTSKIVEKTKEHSWEIKNGSALVDEIRYSNTVVNNIILLGNLHNHIVNFTMPGTVFADGTLFAKGKYDIKNETSDIDFAATDIDSNSAAGMLLNLKDQVEGKANAMMHLTTSDGLDNIDAHTEFFIENGALTKIGSTEFMIKKNKRIKRNLKFKLTDIINVDIEKMKALKSNLYGSFDVHNYELNNVQIFSKHKYLSLFTEGNYNMESEDANIRVFGRYNRTAQKNIRILFIPLSWITKIVLRPEDSRAMYQEQLSKIPPIDAKKFEEVDFVVRMSGNVNDNSSIKVELKRIK